MQANRLLIPGARVEGRTSQLCLLVSSCGNVILQGSRTRLKQAGSVRNPPRSFLGRTLPTFFVHGRDTDSQTPANEKGLPAISRKPFLFSMMKWLRGLDLNQRPPGYEPDELPGCSTPRNEYYATCRFSATARRKLPEKFLPRFTRSHTAYFRRVTRHSMWNARR